MCRSWMADRSRRKARSARPTGKKKPASRELPEIYDVVHAGKLLTEMAMFRHCTVIAALAASMTVAPVAVIAGKDQNPIEQLIEKLFKAGTTTNSGVTKPAREAGMSAEQRLLHHQQHSKQTMDDLHVWLQRQLDERHVEPNSALGGAINYLLKRWDALTLFLRKAGAPLDNNICERALKKAILHRKNSLFFLTRKGALVGDIFMSLIYTFELNHVNALDYLNQLQLHAADVAEHPDRWMPWNCRDQLAAMPMTP